jgi:uncharacterized protein
MTLPPLPEHDLASVGFFEALAAGRLDVQRCTSCGTAHLGVLVCDHCGGVQLDCETSTGSGTIYSSTRIHIAHHPAFAERLPYAAGIVELWEGPRLFAALLGEVKLAIGAPVTLEMQNFGDRNIPAFRLITEVI